jgi:hypothetical protein
MKNQIVKRVLDAAFLLTLLAAFTTVASASGKPGNFAPDTASTAGLLSFVCAGFAIVRAKFRR